MMADLLAGFKPFYKNVLEKFMSETCKNNNALTGRQFVIVS